MPPHSRATVRIRFSRRRRARDRHTTIASSGASSTSSLRASAASPIAHRSRAAARRRRPIAVDQVERQPEGDDHEQHRRRLRHHEAVVHPQVRVDRGDPGGGDARPPPADAAGEQPDADDHRDPDHGHHRPLPRHRIVHPAHRCQQQRRERAVLGARPAVEGVDEAVAIGELHGLGAVPQRVVQAADPGPISTPASRPAPPPRARSRARTSAAARRVAPAQSIAVTGRHASDAGPRGGRPLHSLPL